MEWTQQISGWWMDYLAVATVLLGFVLIARRVIRQPEQRMAMAWSAMVGLVGLAACCAVPGWPRLALFVHSQAATESARVTSPAVIDSISEPKMVNGFLAREDFERRQAVKSLRPSAVVRSQLHDSEPE